MAAKLASYEPTKIYLYIVAARNGLFKIGKTTNPQTRISQIKAASPIECEALSIIEYDDSIGDLESELHIKFARKRVRGEWFALDKDDLLPLVSSNIETKALLDKLQAWGFFELGMNELANNGTIKAAMYRMEALNVLDQERID